MNNRLVRTILTVYLVMVFATIPFVVRADWPSMPYCTLPMLYNADFNNGLMGWYPNTYWPPFGIPGATDNPMPGVFMRFEQYIEQPATLPSGDYHLRLGVLLDAVSPTCGEANKWGSLSVYLNNNLLQQFSLPNSSMDTYHQFSFDFHLPAESGGYLRLNYWPGDNNGVSGCVNLVDALLTNVVVDWISLCQEPAPTWTPTVTGTPPDTATPTTTATVFCEDVTWPTATPYPTQTEYPTPTEWLTPPVFLTPTPAPTYTAWPTCLPAPSLTPYASATPFRFNVPLTYTNRFDNLENGFSEFFTSTDSLISDVQGIMISASTAMSNVTNFGITNTINISGTPVATTDMVSTFVSNMDALRYVFGWFGVFGSIAPTPFWFLLLCLAWSFFVLAFKWVSTFFTSTLWPLARTIWDIIIDIWNAIPFI